MQLVFAGTPEVALPSLEALLASDHEVVAVITRPDAPSGRGRSLKPSPVAARALELGIEVLRPARPRDPDFVARLTKIAPDCAPVVAYGALIPQHVIDIPTYGWVNLHFSLLPAWRGAAPVQHAVLHGDAVTGASTFQLVAALDAGPVFGTVTDTVGPTDTSGDLLTRLAQSGAQLLRTTMDDLAAGTARSVEQPTDGITLAPKLTVEDGRVDWSADAVVIDRLVRGCSPAPGAWTTFRGERLKVLTARPGEPGEPGQETLTPGMLRVTKRSVQVGTAGAPLELIQIQAQGKKPMVAADWARGVTFVAGETLGGS